MVALEACTSTHIAGAARRGYPVTLADVPMLGTRDTGRLMRALGA